jgi:hypothetical protein
MKKTAKATKPDLSPVPFNLKEVLVEVYNLKDDGTEKLDYIIVNGKVIDSVSLRNARPNS